MPPFMIGEENLTPGEEGMKIYLVKICRLKILQWVSELWVEGGDAKRYTKTHLVTRI
jgi:hypothetical protein